MMSRLFLFSLLAACTLAQAAPFPFDGASFKGRIAWSADGNYNDEDDWAASPAIDEPYMADRAVYDVEIRCRAAGAKAAGFALLVNGTEAGPGWKVEPAGREWRSHVVKNVLLNRGDQLAVVEKESTAGAGLDFIELKKR